ncbi:hypothetical protein RSAG8_07734, partial [Rhizoctonia solani AG-8 WAC10335]
TFVKLARCEYARDSRYTIYIIYIWPSFRGKP